MAEADAATQKELESPTLLNITSSFRLQSKIHRGQARGADGSSQDRPRTTGQHLERSVNARSGVKRRSRRGVLVCKKAALDSSSFS